MLPVAGKKSELGPTGLALAQNVRRIRETRRLGYAELSRLLADLGRDIPPLGLRRVEAGERRVDADDLVALAIALGVSPITWLMPAAEKASDLVEVTGFPGRVPAEKFWSWLTADRALPDVADVVRVLGPVYLLIAQFGALAWPPFVRERKQEEANARLDKALGGADGDD